MENIQIYRLDTDKFFSIKNRANLMIIKFLFKSHLLFIDLREEAQLKLRHARTK